MLRLLLKRSDLKSDRKRLLNVNKNHLHCLNLCNFEVLQTAFMMWDEQRCITAKKEKADISFALVATSNNICRYVLKFVLLKVSTEACKKPMQSQPQLFSLGVVYNYVGPWVSKNFPAKT